MAHAGARGAGGDRGGAALWRMDCAVPCVAAEQVRAEYLAALPRYSQTVSQGGRASRACLAALSVRTVRRIRFDGLRGGDHSLDGDAITLLERRRCDRVGRLVSHGAGLPLARSHGCRYRV